MAKRKADDLEKEEFALDSALSPLESLLSLSPSEVGEEKGDFVSHFDKIATFLFSSVSLAVGKTRYRLAEIEFYLNGGAHPDTYTHSSQEQQACSTWYFHKHGSRFREGTYKGLDITFGAENKCHGGILIRAVQPAGDPRAPILEGPCVVVDKILSHLGLDKAADLARSPELRTSVFHPQSCLRLVPDKHVPLPIVKCPRVGLQLKQGTKDKVDYILRDYRYLIYPKMHKKGKIHIISSMLGSGLSPRQVVEQTSTKLPTIENYLEAYKKDKPSLTLASFVAQDALNALKEFAFFTFLKEKLKEME